MNKKLQQWFETNLDNQDSKIFIRVDGAKKRGLSFGHLTRCDFLSKEIEQLFNIKPVFICKNYPETINYLNRNHLTSLLTPNSISFAEEVEFIKELGLQKGAILIFDLPWDKFPEGFFDILNQKKIKVLYIDDCRYRHPDSIDAYLNSSILADTKMIERSNKVNYFLGIEYFIFPEIVTKEKNKTEELPLVITITFGGADPSGLTLKVLSSLSKIETKNIVIKVILGPAFNEINKAKSLISVNDLPIQLIINPKEIYSYLNASDLVICAGGRTLYELHYLNVESFPIASIEHEQKVIKDFSRLNLIKDYLLEWNSEKFIYLLNKQINYKKSKLRKK